MVNLIGMMWNRNEADILEEVIESALLKVDTLFIADDNSTDSSWAIIQSMADKYKDKIEYIRNRREHELDKGQRNSLLNEIRKRYKAEDTWVQIIESDIMILDTDIRAKLEKFSVLDMAMSWQLLNAVRQVGTWNEVDTYPNWKESITKIMPYGHRIEAMLYTFRPLPKLYFELDYWRPWPRGFSYYAPNATYIKDQRRYKDGPLLAHYGYRGPSHIWNKFNPTKKVSCISSKGYDFSTKESTEQTFPFLNGIWNNSLAHSMDRIGWEKSRSGKQWSWCEDSLQEDKRKGHR